MISFGRALLELKAASSQLAKGSGATGCMTLPVPRGGPPRAPAGLALSLLLRIRYAQYLESQPTEHSPEAGQIDPAGGVQTLPSSDNPGGHKRSPQTRVGRPRIVPVPC